MLTDAHIMSTISKGIIPDAKKDAVRNEPIFWNSLFLSELNDRPALKILLGNRFSHYFRVEPYR